MSGSRDISSTLASLSPQQREALLKKLKGATKPKATHPPKIIRANETATHRPLSFAQMRMWLLEQLAHEPGLYNIAAAISLKGNLDVNALKNTIYKIVERHEALRTTFTVVNDTPMQKVNPPGTVHYEIETLLTNNQNLESTINKAIQDESKTSFDLAKGPLLKTKLLKISDSEYVLIFVMHHIIADGWSTRVFAKELTEIYSAYRNNEALELKDLNIQYGDYAEWQQKWLSGETLDKQVAFWKSYLDKVEVLELPTERQRPASQSFIGSHHSFYLDKARVNALRTIAKNESASLFMVLFSIYSVLLNRYTDQEDVCIGTPVANRNQVDIEPLIGFFVNTLPIRTHVLKQQSFVELTQKTSSSILQAFNNQDTPFEKIVETNSAYRVASHSPIFQTFFSLDKIDLSETIKLPDLSAKFLNADIDVAKFDLSLNCKEQKDRVFCEFEFNTALFDIANIERMAQHFIEITDSIIRKPETKICDINVLPSDELEQLLDIWNNTNVNISEKTVVDLIEEQAARTPNSIAVIAGKKQIDYDTLNRKANKLAWHLESLGAKKGAHIGICIPSGIDITIAVLAILKTGAAYVPMDTRYPKDRLIHIIETAEINLLLSTHTFDFLANDYLQLINIENDAPWSNFGEENLNKSISPNDDLYVVFTSGSTGIPKGAGVTHKNETNLLTWYTDKFQMNENDRCLIISAFGFDLTQKNIFALLTKGGCIAFPTSDTYDNTKILSEIERLSITMINCAPSAFYPVVECCNELRRLASLRLVLFGGEPIRLESLSRWILSDCYNAKLVNMYGPTECTDIAASYVIENPANYFGNTIPIGRPNSNVQLYVLDEKLLPVPIGVVGELYIGGAGVGTGYINNQVQTASRFIKNPFSTGKIYKTGDLVRYRNDGNLEFVDRIDGQVKIRGFRIELGEIESKINELEGVGECVISAVTTEQGDILAAYIVQSVNQDPINIERIKKVLNESLPEYMIPQVYIPIDKIPLTPNGKIDRRALPKPEAADYLTTPYVAPRSKLEQQIAEIWAEVLNAKRVGINDNFFESGGHSLLATKLLTRIRDNFDIELPLKVVFDSPSVARLSELISAITNNNTNCADDNELLGDDDYEEGLL